MRATHALSSLRLKPWPWRGPIAVRERDADRRQMELHVVDRWCYLGTARSEADLDEVCGARAGAVFDPAIYRILTRFLRSPPRSCDILPLPATDSFARS
jgi:DNA polymerase-3 subunit epsilon